MSIRNQTKHLPSFLGDDLGVAMISCWVLSWVYFGAHFCHELYRAVEGRTSYVDAGLMFVMLALTFWGGLLLMYFVFRYRRPV
jgi:hypothetical protein